MCRYHQQYHGIPEYGKFQQTVILNTGSIIADISNCAQGPGQPWQAGRLHPALHQLRAREEVSYGRLRKCRIWKIWQLLFVIL